LVGQSPGPVGRELALSGEEPSFSGSDLGFKRHKANIIGANLYMNFSKLDLFVFDPDVIGANLILVGLNLEPNGKKADQVGANMNTSFRILAPAGFVLNIIFSKMNKKGGQPMMGRPPLIMMER
jgi:hypothetical protein